MTAPTDLYRANQRRHQALALLLSREWAAVGEDLDTSWSRVGPRVNALIANAQAGAAYDGALSVHQSLGSVGALVIPAAVILPEAWAGWTDQGLPLDRLTYGSVVASRKAEADSWAMRKQVGLDWLTHVAREQVGSASRGAAQVAVATREGVGYTRLVNPPCCKDCAVLAGKWFRWNTGFQRHAGCDCTHVAVAGGTVPSGYVPEVPTAQIHDLSDAERRALAEGADLSQVVNAARGAKGHLTTEGATGRGLAGRHLGAGRGQVTASRRLTVDAIYAKGGSREAVLQRLEENGYLLTGGRGPAYEGFGQMGRGGTRVAARAEVERARRTGVRDPSSLYTMTAAERRAFDRELRAALATP